MLFGVFTGYDLLLDNYSNILCPGTAATPGSGSICSRKGVRFPPPLVLRVFRMVDNTGRKIQYSTGVKGQNDVRFMFFSGDDVRR